MLLPIQAPVDSFLLRGMTAIAVPREQNWAGLHGTSFTLLPSGPGPCYAEWAVRLERRRPWRFSLYVGAFRTPTWSGGWLELSLHVPDAPFACGCAALDLATDQLKAASRETVSAQVAQLGEGWRLFAVDGAAPDFDCLARARIAFVTGYSTPPPGVVVGDISLVQQGPAPYIRVKG